MPGFATLPSIVASLEKRWIRVTKIPLYLWSTDLFEDITTLFGCIEKLEKFGEEPEEMVSLKIPIANCNLLTMSVITKVYDMGVCYPTLLSPVLNSVIPMVESVKSIDRSTTKLGPGDGDEVAEHYSLV